MSGLSSPTARDIIDDILRREGSSYTNRASDRGGPTRFGITLATLRRHRTWATAADVQNLTEGEARSIYEQNYVVGPGFDLVPEPLRSLMVDFGVTSSPSRATKALQAALATKTDGILGPATRELLLSRANVDAVYAAVLRQYLAHFVSVVLLDPVVIAFRHAQPDTQLSNLAGWVNRASEFIR